MPNVLVGDVPDDVHVELQRKAELRHQSLQQYLAAELRQLAKWRSVSEVLDEVEASRAGASALRRPLLIWTRNAPGNDISAPDLVDVETDNAMWDTWFKANPKPSKSQVLAFRNSIQHFYVYAGPGVRHYPGFP